ncbi:hypothetical protein ACGFYP_34355 [Streptomyces sp. NPDC048370]|uniref:hypothetical protein n=1 Tax=Streptomyces sp. NPDC048370 TaxID=3365540 RepID=UPI00371669EE
MPGLFARALATRGAALLTAFLAVGAVVSYTPATAAPAGRSAEPGAEALAGYALMENDHRADAGLDSCLRTFSGNSTVEVGDCVGQGGATDYTSMRQ